MQMRILLALSVAVVCASAQAETNTFTLYGGYRGGGGFIDAANNNTLSLQGAPAGTVSMDFGIDPSRQVQVFFSRQSTDLSVPATTQPVAAATRLPMNISYAHIGGTNFFDGPIGKGPYVAGGLGVTVFELTGNGYGTEVHPSLSLAVGYQLPVTEHIAFRMEARMYSTLINSSSNLFCSGGCVLAIKGDSVTQAEALLGLSVSF